MLEVSEVCKTLLYYEQLIKGYVCRRCQKWYLWLLHNNAYRVLLLTSEVLKVIVLCIQWLITPARREGYLFEPSVLGI